MASQIMMAILLRPGDVILWGFPEAEEVTIKKIHNSDPVAGKLRIESTAGDLRVSSRRNFHVKVMWKGTGT